MLKMKTKILQELTAPSEYTGGTQMRVPSGLNLGYPEFVLAEPNFGIRLIRQGCKSRQYAILTRETIFKIFEKS